MQDLMENVRSRAQQRHMLLSLPRKQSQLPSLPAHGYISFLFSLVFWLSFPHIYMIEVECKMNAKIGRGQAQERRSKRKHDMKQLWEQWPLEGEDHEEQEEGENEKSEDEGEPPVKDGADKDDEIPKNKMKRLKVKNGDDENQTNNPRNNLNQANTQSQQDPAQDERASQNLSKNFKCSTWGQ